MSVYTDFTLSQFEEKRATFALRDLYAMRSELYQEAQPLLARIDSEDNPLDDIEVARTDEIASILEEVNNEIDVRAEKQNDLKKRRQVIDDVGKRIGTKPEPKTRATSAGRVSDMKVLLEDDPNKGFKNPRQFLMDVMHSSIGRRVSNPDGLAYLKVRPGQVEVTAGADEQGVYDDQYGGFLVPQGMSPELLSVGGEVDPMGGRTRSVPMENTAVSFNARVDKDHSSSVSGGLTVGRKAETVAATASRMQFEQVVLRAYSLFGFAYATEEILTDSPSSFAAIIAAGFGDEFVNEIVKERLNGTGTGEFLGINNSASLITITKETGQAADTVVYENVINMRARVWGYNNAIWLANPDTLPQLMLMNQSVGTGGVPVWQPSAREDAPDMLLGRPLIFTDYAATVGDAGDILCTNWGEYLEGVYQPLQSAESIHVRFSNHERAFKFWMRNAGAPWWRSALTPVTGSNTRSPFVRLGARA